MSRKNKKGKADSSTPSVFSLLKPYKKLISILILLALLGSAVNMIIPKIISHHINAFSQGTFQMNQLIWELLAASIAIFIFTYLQSIIQTTASEKVAKDIRTQLSDKISSQSMSYILKANPAKLLTNLTSDIDSIKMFVSHAFVTIISSLFVIVGTSILLISIHWKLALAVIAIVPLIAVTFFIILKKVRVYFKKSRMVIDSLNKTINESILCSAIIRVINSQQIESLKFIEVNTEAKNIGMSILKLFAALIPIIMFISNIAIVTILALGGHYVVAGTLNLGDFAAFNSYLMLLIFPILMIGFMSNIIAQATASYQRIYEVLEAEVDSMEGKIEKKIQGNIQIKNLNLSYGEKPVLKNINISILAGTKTAIIGPTAAGKSQLLYLLTNLIRPETGEIYMDGDSICDYSKRNFHAQIGFVFQDSVVFNLSLRENIAFNESVTEDSLLKAIQTAELEEFISNLPGKLDAVLSERGTSLSGGQKQRIMLARALALNPSVLLLDDFTARVDNKTESRILQNIQENYPGITLVSVTQKIAPVKDFDQIILLMEGEVIACGLHRDLLSSSPEYAQIYNSQRSTSHYEV